MQIAGTHCVVCRHPIGIVRDGAGCETCQITVHKACVENDVCPTCGRRFLPTQEVHARPGAWRQTERDRPRAVTVFGRLTLAGVPIGAVMSIGGVVMMASDVWQGLATVVGGVLLAALSFAVGTAVLNGHDWARRLYLWGTPLALATDPILARTVFRQEFFWWRFVLEGALYCTWAYLLTRPSAVAFFSRGSTS